MKKRILIIEDNEDIRDNTCELLELKGFDVAVASNGAEGFREAKVFRPNLVLCDMMMPDSDGRQFLKLAKADRIVSKVPVVFFSAGSLSPEAQQVLIEVANGYLKKPFSEEELLYIIRKALQKGDGSPASS